MNIAKPLTFWMTVTASILGVISLLRPSLDGNLRSYQEPTHARDLPRLAQVVTEVDRQFRDAWAEAGLQPSAAADEMTLVRRLSLGLVGTVPSTEELRQLVSIPAGQRVDWWLDQAFADRRCSDYLAERFARCFVGTEDGPFLVFRRRRFVSWLSDQFLGNRPYDQLVRELIQEEGLWTDSPAVNFVTVTNGTNEKDQPDPARLAARTTRAFLGVRLDCVQCHDDHLGGEWRQSDFHQLAAFFAEARSSLVGISDTPRNYEYQYLGAAESEIVAPQVPFCSDDLPAEGRHREQLARWVTRSENQAFARSTVNRVWALLFGKPLVAPVDNIPLHGPYPAGLQSLAQDFATHGFDLQRLIRAITATEVFRRDSRAAHPLTAAHEEHWAAFPLTRLRPDQVAGAIIQSASLTTIDSQSHLLWRFLRAIESGEFVQRYGDTGEDEFDGRGGTIPQRLVLLNGKLVHERTEVNPIANAATRIAQLTKDDAQAVRAVYLATLTREPCADEVACFVKFLQDQRGEARGQAMQDVAWCLINSAEFAWNH
jgi:hypothetical protein